MPAPNKSYLRLYGHTLCPFVERVRLVLTGVPYQDVQINLELRTKWHYYLNNGMVPILETPKDDPLFGQHYIIFESKLIMDFLNHKLNLNLFSADPFKKAEQLRLMDLLDKLPVYLL
jgi:glutathione S-transferase